MQSKVSRFCRCLPVWHQWVLGMFWVKVFLSPASHIEMMMMTVCWVSMLQQHACCAFNNNNKKKVKMRSERWIQATPSLCTILTQQYCLVETWVIFWRERELKQGDITQPHLLTSPDMRTAGWHHPASPSNQSRHAYSRVASPSLTF